MNNKHIHVTTAANENYAPGLLVMMASALTSLDPDAVITIHFFNGGLAQDSLERLERICRSLHPHCRLVNIPFDESVFTDCTVGPGNSFICYTRLMLGTMLDVEKVIYIDSDILVLKDLKEAWELDMQGKIALACQEPGSQTICNDCPWPLDEEDRNKLYFNSGFMVIDLKQWREKSVEAKSLKLARTTICKWFDQTILNYVLRDDIYFISDHWNRLCWNEQRNLNHETSPSVLKNYHFVSSGGKPWAVYCNDFRFKLWRLYGSAFVGNPFWQLFVKRKYQRIILWSKDYLIQNSAWLALLYKGYLNVVYDAKTAKVHELKLALKKFSGWGVGQNPESNHLRLAREETVRQVRRKIRSKVF